MFATRTLISSLAVYFVVLCFYTFLLCNCLLYFFTFVLPHNYGAIKNDKQKIMVI